ncbi:MAG: polysaccharide deacetylase family protein [Bacteroidota bacterium]
MFTFRRLTVIFFITLMSLNLWNLFLSKSTGGFIHDHATWIYTLLFILYFGISFLMAFLPCSNFHYPVICHGQTNEKSVSITFDDGPDPDKTPIILEILKKHEVKAAFFCIGKNIKNNELLLNQMINEGHVLGNHSFSHSKWFDLFPARRMKAEMMETDLLIKHITGKSPLFFRPPFGVLNPMVSNALKMMHWHVVCWNIRSLDTIKRNPSQISQKIIRQLKPGAIILLHDFTPFTEHHLDDLLYRIRDAGYRIESLDKLLKLNAYV